MDDWMEGWMDGWVDGWQMNTYNFIQWFVMIYWVGAPFCVLLKGTGLCLFVQVSLARDQP